MIPPQWYFVVMRLDQADDPVACVDHPQYLVWPPKNGMKLVVFAVLQADYDTLKKDPRYVTDDLKDLREKHANTMVSFIGGNTLAADGKFAIPMCYAGAHQGQITAIKAVIHA